MTVFAAGTQSSPAEADVTKYVIEREGRLWVLRRSGRRETIASDSDLIALREQAFARQRIYAPCSLRILSDIREEWLLERREGEWSRVVTVAVPPRPAN